MMQDYQTESKKGEFEAIRENYQRFLKSIPILSPIICKEAVSQFGPTLSLS